MPDVFCGNTDKCQMCPKSVENAVFHVFHKQGFHIPVIRSEFNFMLFILKGEILVNSEEYAGTTVKTGEFILQPITAKIEILAMIDRNVFITASINRSCFVINVTTIL